MSCKLVGALLYNTDDGDVPHHLVYHRLLSVTIIHFFLATTSLAVNIVYVIEHYTP